MTAVAGAVWTTPASPVQHAAVAAYGDDPELDAYIRACAAIQGRMTRFLHRGLTDLEVPCPEPSGAFYLYPSFRPWAEPLRAVHSVESCGDLCSLLLREAEIATLPGCDFGSDPSWLALRLSTSQLHRLGEASVERVVALASPAVSDEDFHRQVCPDLAEVAARLERFVGALDEVRVA